MRHAVAGLHSFYYPSVPRKPPLDIAISKGRSPPLRLSTAGPQNWGVANDALALPSAANVQREVRGARREVFAKRLDPFEALHRRGGLTTAQLLASARLFADWCESAGVRTDDARELLELRSSPRCGPSDLVNCRMIDASARFEEALAAVGPATGEVLRALVAPAVMCGSVLVWRAVVERVTGETHTHAQASVVRRACEDLRLAYDRLDRASHARPAGDASAAAASACRTTWRGASTIGPPRRRRLSRRPEACDQLMCSAARVASSSEIRPCVRSRSSRQSWAVQATAEKRSGLLTHASCFAAAAASGDQFAGGMIATMR